MKRTKETTERVMYLMNEVIRLITLYNLTQKETTEILGIKQARLSNVLYPEKYSDHFSTDCLMNYLNLLGMKLVFGTKGSNNKLSVSVEFDSDIVKKIRRRKSRKVRRLPKVSVNTSIEA